jgi:hypothetical protein
MSMASTSNGWQGRQPAKVENTVFEVPQSRWEKWLLRPVDWLHHPQVINSNGRTTLVISKTKSLVTHRLPLAFETGTTYASVTQCLDDAHPFSLFTLAHCLILYGLAPLVDFPCSPRSHQDAPSNAGYLLSLLSFVVFSLKQHYFRLHYSLDIRRPIHSAQEQDRSSRLSYPTIGHQEYNRTRQGCNLNILFCHAFVAAKPGYFVCANKPLPSSILRGWRVLQVCG